MHGTAQILSASLCRRRSWPALVCVAVASGGASHKHPSVFLPLRLLASVGASWCLQQLHGTVTHRLWQPGWASCRHTLPAMPEGPALESRGHVSRHVSGFGTQLIVTFASGKTLCHTPCCLWEGVSPRFLCRLEPQFWQGW